MNEVNIPLLRKAVEWVEDQDKLPEIDREWDQRDWVSPPFIRALTLTAGTETPRDSSDDAVSRYKRKVHQVAAHCGTAYCVAGYIGQLMDSRYAEHQIVDGIEVEDFARVQLGLNEGQANMLFSGSNSAADIRQFAEQFAEQKL